MIVYIREAMVGFLTFNYKRMVAGLFFIFLDLFFHKEEVEIDEGEIQQRGKIVR